jgi:hypothetical protein
MEDEKLMAKKGISTLDFPRGVYPIYTPRMPTQSDSDDLPCLEEEDSDADSTCDDDWSEGFPEPEEEATLETAKLNVGAIMSGDFVSDAEITFHGAAHHAAGDETEEPKSSGICAMKPATSPVPSLKAMKPATSPVPSLKGQGPFDGADAMKPATSPVPSLKGQGPFRGADAESRRVPLWALTESW